MKNSTPSVRIKSRSVCNEEGGMNRTLLAVLLVLGSLTTNLFCQGYTDSSIGPTDTSMSCVYKNGQYQLECQSTFIDTTAAYSFMMQFLQFYATNNPNGMYYDISMEDGWYKIIHKLSPPYKVNEYTANIQMSMMKCEENVLTIIDTFAPGVPFQEQMELLELSTGRILYDGAATRK